MMTDKKEPIAVKLLHQRQIPRGKRLDPKKTMATARKVTAAYVRMEREIPSPRPRPWHTPHY